MNNLNLSAAGLAALLLAATVPARAEYPVTTQATLLSRIQIEDLLVSYYSGFGASKDDFANSYLEEGVLDVNGTIYTGRAAIKGAYSGAPAAQGAFHMLMTNPRIRIDGDTATAEVLWTGVNNDNVKAAPRFIEQGREVDQLVRRDGRWFLKRREITSDGGLPEAYEKNYRKR